MKSRIQIPHEWWQYQQRPAHFITYFGEIYFGSIWQCPGHEESFFIIQNDKIREVRELKAEQRTLEIYQRLGREIKDINVIKRVRDGHLGRDITFSPMSYFGDQQFKRMFVLGAAASAFCIFGDSSSKFRESLHCPPTGFEILSEKYDSLIAQFPGAKATITLVESMGKDIEQAMESEWQTFKSYYSPEVANRHLNLQYYLHSLLKKISKEVVEKFYRNNLYALLLNKIQLFSARNPKERISFVNFNYDTILEDFITSIFQYHFNSMPEYIDWNRRKILVFKPHGSCNWGWRFKPEKLNGIKQDQIAEALYTQRIEPWQVYFDLIGDLDEVIANNSWGHEYQNDPHFRGRFTINKNLIERIPDKTNDVYFPALLIPYRDKDEVVMPYDHFDAMQHCIESMEEIYLIGWKGNERLFNKQLKRAQKLQRIIIVNPDADSVIQNLSSVIDLKKVKIEKVPNFEEFVLKHIDNYLS